LPERFAVFAHFQGGKGWSTGCSPINRRPTIRNGDMVLQGTAERHGAIHDIEANAETHSLTFARGFETVHAFEPKPILWPQFERNMMLNGLINIRLHRLGHEDRKSDRNWGGASGCREDRCSGIRAWRAARSPQYSETVQARNLVRNWLGYVGKDGDDR
jgi:FkbM family methyltransferase